MHELYAGNCVNCTVAFFKCAQKYAIEICVSYMLGICIFSKCAQKYAIEICVCKLHLANFVYFSNALKSMLQKC